MLLWLNGQLVQNGFIDASGAGVLSGWGVFTTAGVKNGVVGFARRHIARLQRDAASAQIRLQYSPDEIYAAIHDVLKANSFRDGLLRLTLTQRSDGRWNQDEGSDLSIQVVATFSIKSLPRVQRSRYLVQSEHPLAGVKTTSYLPYLWAWREAKAAGFDEAIIQDDWRGICEGARANLFWLVGEEIHTPSLKTGCLRGLGRELVLEWAQSRGFIIHEGRYTNIEAFHSDAAYLVSAAAGPKRIASWHDETGDILWHWNDSPALEAELLDWWQKESSIDD